jgi:WD40 repeat protein
MTVWDVRLPQQPGAHVQLAQRATAAWCAAWRSGRDGRLASGGNDGLLNMWDLRRLTTQPTRLTFEQHRAAAVKAIAWHPDVRNVLASGGGSADRYLRLWDVDARRCFNRRDSRSQVTGLLWSTQPQRAGVVARLLGGGRASRVWSDAGDLQRVAQLHDHPSARARALHGRLALRPLRRRSPTLCARSASTRCSCPDVEHALHDDENSDGNWHDCRPRSTATYGGVGGVGRRHLRRRRRRSLAERSRKRSASSARLEAPASLWVRDSLMACGSGTN